MSPRFTFVVAARDEAPALPELARRLVAVGEALGDFEVLVVDDGSRDDSVTWLTQHASRDARFTVVPLGARRGKSAALAAGFARARGEVLITCDADLQDDLESVPRLLAALDAGFDLVVGARVDRVDDPVRVAASRVFNVAVSLAAQQWVQDVNSGLKVLRAELARALPLPDGHHRFLALLAAQRGARVLELPVGHAARAHDASRYGPERYLEAARGFLEVLGAPPRRPSHGSLQKYEAVNPLQRALVRAHLALLTRVARSVRPARVLEVGCGPGFVLDALARGGVGQHLVAVEPDATSARLAQARLGARARVVHGELSALDSGERFDLVVCSEVLEHVAEPGRLLAALLQRAPRVLVSVPWEPWFRALALGRGRHVARWGLDPEHRHAFDREALERLVRQAGEVTWRGVSFPWQVVLVARRG